MKECSTVSFKGQVIYCGIDVHKKSWHVTIRHCCHQIENFRVLMYLTLIYPQIPVKTQQHKARELPLDFYIIERNVHDDDENRGMDHLPEGVPR